MKALCAVLLVFMAVALVADAKKKNQCKYHKASKWSDCDGERQFILQTLKTDVSADHCSKSKRKYRPCVPGAKAKCIYIKRNWTECDTATNTQSRTLVLKDGGSHCSETRLKTRKCKKECVYEKGSWSECNAVTKKKTRTMTLVKGGEQCMKTKTKEKKCKKAKNGKACKYERGSWSVCNPATNQMHRKLTLKDGSDACAPVKMVTKKCRRRAALTAPKFQTKCKYEFADWDQCDLTTNTRTRVMNLVAGDPEKCPLSKELKRKCRNPCKFRKGKWSPCDPITSLMTREDTLVKGNEVCSKTRQLTKKCKKNKRKCVYDAGVWSDCDPLTNKRTRVRTLKKGDPKMCEPEKQMSKPCSRPNGKERCFFGKWGEFGPCMNGVMTKARELIQGGTECERKAVRTKACQ